MNLLVIFETLSSRKPDPGWGEAFPVTRRRASLAKLRDLSTIRCWWRNVVCGADPARPGDLKELQAGDGHHFGAVSRARI